MLASNLFTGSALGLLDGSTSGNLRDAPILPDNRHTMDTICQIILARGRGLERRS